MNNLAGTWEAEGKYSQAETLLTKIVMVRRRVLGPEHPRTLSSMDTLGRLFGIKATMRKLSHC